MTRNTQDQQPRTREAASDGSVYAPVAWVAFATDASESRAVCLTRQEAETVSRKHGWGVAPLYAVRLTDEERGAVAEAAHWLDEYFDPVIANTLRGLLERLK